MVEEGTLGLVRSGETPDQFSKPGDDSSKQELQHRMEVTRESISHTVDEIKDTVVNQYESVKDTISKTLDWHEQVKKRPVAWSAGALGAGFVVGYGVAAVAKGKGNGRARNEYVPSKRRTIGVSTASQNFASAAQPALEEAPRAGVIERFKETAAFDRLKQESAVVGNRFVDEISKKAQEVILPAAMAWVGSWLERLVSSKDKQQAKHDELAQVSK